MQINSLQSVGSVFQATRANNAKASDPVSASTPVPSAVDQLDLSSEAQELMAGGSIVSAGSDDIRMERVSSIRQAIAEGTYETPERMDAALDRLLDAIA